MEAGGIPGCRALFMGFTTVIIDLFPLPTAILVYFGLIIFTIGTIYGPI